MGYRALPYLPYLFCTFPPPRTPEKHPMTIDLTPTAVVGLVSVSAAMLGLGLFSWLKERHRARVWHSWRRVAEACAQAGQPAPQPPDDRRR